MTHAVFRWRKVAVWAAILLLTTSRATSEVGAEEVQDSPAMIRALGASSPLELQQAVAAIGAQNDVAALPALEALRDRRLRSDNSGNVYIIDEDEKTVRDAVTQEIVSVDAAQLETPVISNVVRRTLASVLGQLQLQSADPATRLRAAEELNKRPRADALDVIKAALQKETEASVRSVLQVTLAQVQLSSADPEVRIDAVRMVGESGDLNLRPKLEALVATQADGSFVEPDERVRQAAEVALTSFERAQMFISTVGNILYGLSLGSILLLAALGLAITFGLMGVINMAHGEMLMLGAYATYVVQRLFQTYAPNIFDAYVLVAIPVAFAVSGGVGMLLERSVIRFLYGRPLETLLATWGISLILIQTVRSLFGAQNVEVANPAWLSGGVEVLQGVVFPYSRLAIIAFVILVVSVMWLLLQRTRLGLHVRAVTQNRPMASCLGIATSRVDMWTFGLGSGLAGLGGVALSQIGNVGPELGQGYIIDSFMVVVLGGVGNIAGTVVGGLGLGLVNKFLEPFAGAVMGKIGVLIFIILFIQRRPQGLFALKGRMVEA
ncbi:MAG: urea ABC transporter permease subunit UrtB [Candidatus Binatia bacterium]